MGNHFSFEPADDLETFCQNQCSCCSYYKFKFRLKCTGGGAPSCLFNSLSVTFLTYCSQELLNFVEFSDQSTYNKKHFSNVTTTVINDGKTLKINFDDITVQAGRSIDVVLCFKIKDLPCEKPIKIKLDITETELLSNIIRIHDLPCKPSCRSYECKKSCQKIRCDRRCC